MTERISKIWSYYTVNIEDDIIKCNITGCLKSYKYSTLQGTSNLSYHICKFHKIEMNIEKKQNAEKESDKNNIDEILTKWIINDNQSFRVVENKFFLQFVSLLNNNYKLLNRKNIALNIDTLYDKKFNDIKTMLSKIDSKFSFSFDIWSSIKRHSYLGLKIHYLDENFIYNSYTIDFYHITVSHSGENLSQIISDILKKFGINNIKSMICDNATNNLKCYEYLKKNNFKNINFVGCLAHVLNLIIKNGPFKNISSIIKIRSIVIKIHYSPKMTQSLEVLAQTNFLTYYTLVLDVSTRWNSTYLMIDSFIKNEKLFKLYAPTMILTEQEWNEIKECHKLLYPFYEMTQIMCSSKFPSISFCYLMILEIKNTINEFKNSQNFKILSQKMEIKFNKHCSSINEDYLISMLLDPRIKLKKVECEQQKTFILNKFNEIYTEYSNNFFKNVDMKIIKNDSIKKSGLFDSFFDNNEIEINDEINRYLNSPLVDKNYDILSFWNNNKKNYPILSKIARDYLCIPATSVNCEEMFSEAGEMITVRRNKLSTKIITKMMCLHSWI